jgi:hypothetical protein
MKAVPPKTVNPRALATIWIVALAVVAVFELLARLRPAPVWQREEEQLVEHRAAKVDRLRGGEVLLFGDSSLGTDVDERVLSEALGREAKNLALVATFTTVGDRFLLERALRRGAKPSAVVLFHTPDLWPRPFEEGFYRVVQRGAGAPGLEALAHDLAHQLALARQSRAWKLGTLVPGRGLGWAPQRVQDQVTKAEAARVALPATDYIPPATAAPPDWAAKEAQFASGAWQPVTITNPNPDPTFRVDAHVERWLDATLDLAAEHEVPVFVAICPTWTPKILRPENRAYVRDLMRWLAERSEGGTRFRLLWEPVLVMGAEWTGDKPEHLAAHAREPFSRWLGKRLADALAGRTEGAPHGELWDPFRDAAVVVPP